MDLQSHLDSGFIWIYKCGADVEVDKEIFAIVGQKGFASSQTWIEESGTENHPSFIQCSFNCGILKLLSLLLQLATWSITDFTP